MIMNSLDINQVTSYIAASSANSKIYIGCDSERFRYKNKWMADYATVAVIHINGNRGAKIFGEVTREMDYDVRPGKPSIRLMKEVYKVVEFYEKIKSSIGERYTEIHLDLNPDEQRGSSCVIQQAIGYIVGTCNIKPVVKPAAFAASAAADRFKELQAAA